ncbi:MAG: Fe(3+) dicitrate transport protein, partial [Patiriisocius sp.]
MNIFKILFFLFLSIPALAQYTVSGTIVSEIDQSLIQGAEVYNVTLGTSVKTNNQGVYVFENIPTGTYDFAAFGFAYDVFEMSKEIAANTTLNFNLQPLGESLSEVLIITRKEKIFALKQLKDVEGTA